MIELLTSLLLVDFSSGSSINFYDNRLYLIGDDANQILILDKEYKQLNSITVFNFKEARIPKKVKADFETSTIVQENDKDYLLILGSASRDTRMGGILLPLENSPDVHGQSDFTTISFVDFVSRIKRHPVGEINLEGSTVIGNQFVLSNRANGDNPTNTFIITSNDFWKRQHDAPIALSRLLLPTSNSGITGVSELCYVASKDLLLMTLSSEQTANAYEDGAIGDSYIGWIHSVSTKINQPELKLDGMTNLSLADDLFKGQKIEGLCVESLEGDALILHLISDNDDGKSRLFKLKLTVE